VRDAYSIKKNLMKNVYIVTFLFLVYLFFVAPANIFVPVVVWVVAFCSAIYMDVMGDLKGAVASFNSKKKITSKK